MATYHHETINSVAELLGAMGFSDPFEVDACHLYRRVSQSEVKSYNELYYFVEPGSFLEGRLPKAYREAYALSQAISFAHPERKGQ